MEHNYMLLARYKLDIEYYLGCGNRSAVHLYFGDYELHIRQTIELWKSLPIKPIWFRASELIKYKLEGENAGITRRP